MTNSFKSPLTIVNRTSLSDLEHFLRLVCFAKEFFVYKIEEGNPAKFLGSPAIVEILDMDLKDLEGFHESLDEFMYSLLEIDEHNADIFKSDIGDYYHHQFKPSNFEYFSDDELHAFAVKNVFDLQYLSATEDAWVNTTFNAQTMLTSMKVEAAFEELTNGKVIEHNCILRNEIEYKIACIHLARLHLVWGMPSNVYWIEGDSWDTNDAIMSQHIGSQNQANVNLDSKTKSRVNGRKFVDNILKRAA